MKIIAAPKQVKKRPTRKGNTLGKNFKVQLLLVSAEQMNRLRWPLCEKKVGNCMSEK